MEICGMNFQQLGQPYSGTVAAIQDLLFPVRTAVQILDVADEINTVDKFEGRQVYNSTNQWIYIADGSLPADTWTLNDGLGATQVTPT